MFQEKNKQENNHQYCSSALFSNNYQKIPKQKITKPAKKCSLKSSLNPSWINFWRLSDQQRKSSEGYSSLLQGYEKMKVQIVIPVTQLNGLEGKKIKQEEEISRKDNLQKIDLHFFQEKDEHSRKQGEKVKNEQSWNPLIFNEDSIGKEREQKNIHILQSNGLIKNQVQRDYFLSSHSREHSSFSPFCSESQEQAINKAFSSKFKFDHNNHFHISEICKFQGAIHFRQAHTQPKSRRMQSPSLNDKNKENLEEQSHLLEQKPSLLLSHSLSSQSEAKEVKKDNKAKKTSEKSVTSELIELNQKEEDNEGERCEEKSVEFQQIEMEPQKESSSLKGMSSRKFLSKVMSSGQEDDEDEQIEEIPEDDYMRSFQTSNFSNSKNRIIRKNFARVKPKKTTGFIYKPTPPGTIYEDVRKHIDQKTLTWSSLAAGKMPSLVRVLDIVQIDGVRYVYGLFWDSREQLMERYVMMPHFLDFYGEELEQYKIDDEKEKTIQITIKNFTS